MSRYRPDDRQQEIGLVLPAGVECDGAAVDVGGPVANVLVDEWTGSGEASPCWFRFRAIDRCGDRAHAAALLYRCEASRVNTPR